MAAELPSEDPGQGQESVVDGEDVDTTSVLNLDEVVAKVEAIKKEGNELFQRGKTFQGHTLGKTSTMDACAKYAQAFTVLEDALLKVSEDGPRENLVDLRVAVLLNLAAASLVLESPQEVINCCNTVLEARPRHPKALFRRAKAHLLQPTPAYDDALKDLETAIRAAPKSRELREEYKRVKTARDKAEAKEAFKRGTEEGRRRLEAKARKEKQEKFLSWAEAQGQTKNGAKLDAYAWGQTVSELTVAVPVEAASASSIQCDISRKHLRLAHGDTTILDKDFLHPIKVDDSYWDHEAREGGVCVVLTKDNASRKETPGYEWWSSAFDGEPEIDTTDCDVGENLAQLPERQKQELAQSIEKQQDDERAREKAMKNPQKRAMFDMLREKFPDVPIDLR
ncbi:Nuclear migration protein nudC [Hondaea fermentalgiana]|uniref:Nuclear migration protein nudC n=1 Tax=Hondaea fermentalgiana TaxID=2315210 RepID=A0A2R5GKU3_9STRA|nr:Nuclear migration protein nudC [Hondaea fermentalgiana]|eukprot:GBG31255.1 Nuclear migration protein nudC [Hondaea fermentalgiana]